MRSILLATSALLCFGNVAIADMTFVQGSTTFTFTSVENFSDTVYGVSTNAAFSTGNWGYQFGGAIVMNPSVSGLHTFVSPDLHFYRETQNGNKFGAFVNVMGMGFGGGGIFDTGVEGMFALGPVDVEASLGVFIAHGPIDRGSFDLDVFYDISDRISVNAGINTIFQFGGPDFDALYSIGASYDIPNSGLVATADYTFHEDVPNGIIQIGLSWKFGPNQDARLFNHGSGVMSDGFYF